MELCFRKQKGLSILKYNAVWCCLFEFEIVSLPSLFGGENIFKLNLILMWFGKFNDFAWVIGNF